jgi:hypothetical protein
LGSRRDGTGSIPVYSIYNFMLYRNVLRIMF